MISSPCKGCPDRHKRCHSECPDYIAYREQKDGELAHERAEYPPITPAIIRAIRKSLNDRRGK